MPDQIISYVGQQGYGRTFVQLEDPATEIDPETGELKYDVRRGDLWIRTTNPATTLVWDNYRTTTWGVMKDNNWGGTLGEAVMYYRNANNEWEVMLDHTDIREAYTRIEQNQDAIVAEAHRASGAEGQLDARLTVAADAITTEVRRAQGAEGQLSTKIEQTAEDIYLGVKTVGAVRTAGSYIQIHDNYINVESSGNINIKAGGSFTVASGNFGIDASGNATFKGGGEFKGTVSLGGTDGGTLIVKNANGNEIGRWDKNGIDVQAGTIHGASMTLGGSNNKYGTLSIQNANGDVIGTWDRNGIDVKSGTIKGASLVLGGSNNRYGTLSIQDADGNEIGRWNRSGIYAKNGTFEGTVSGGTITGGTISGTAISAGTISGASISGGTISGSSISAGSISGASISGGTISGTSISAGTITGATVSGGTISGTSISAGTMTSTTFTGVSGTFTTLSTKNWTFDNSGAKYKTDSGYTMGLGSTNSSFGTNGGIHFEPGYNVGQIQLYARDKEYGGFTAKVILKCSVTNGVTTAAFYQNGSSSNNITLGTYDTPWYKAYITTRYGYYGSMCFQPYENYECKMYCDYNSSRLLLYPVVTPGNISSLGTSDHRWTSLYVGTVYANSISGLTPASIGAVPSNSSTNIAIKAGSYTLQIQTDGNLVIYDGSMQPVWAAR